MERYALQLPDWRGGSGRTAAVVRPYDRKPVAEVELADRAAMEHALGVAAKAQRTWSRSPAWERAEILSRAAARIREEKEELARLIATEGGKPLKDARIEAARAAVTLEECGRAALHLAGETWRMDRAPGAENRLAFTIREPIGVVLAISAFNHPLNLACHQAGAAVAAGNACLLKPATATPLCSLRLAAILTAAGLPEGVLQVLPAPGGEIGPLVESPQIAYVTFIGSAAVGWELRRRVAPGVRLALEHGGNAATIVLADADLDAALPVILRSAFYHAGQVCVSTQRLYVEESVEPEFTARLRAGAEELVYGDPLDPQTDVGPLIAPAEVERVHAWVEEARAQGAEVILGGEPAGPTLYRPTVLRKAPEESRVVAHEVFGPVVVVQPVRNLEEAVARVNRSAYPFQSSIFTADVKRAFAAARAVEASAFMINDITAFRVDWMPFGGRKQAGLGLGGTEHGLRDMTQEKLIVLNV